jgi:hypothetical protein
MRARIVSLLAASAVLGGTVHAATVTVTGGGDGVAVDGAVTLREALASINGGADVNADVAAAGAYGTDDRIEFAIPGAGVHTIQPGTPLPPLAVPMTIDGTTQPGASPNTQTASDDAVLLIEIDGTAAGSGSVGLTVPAAAGGSVIRGLVINRFVFDPMTGGGHGVVLSSAMGCVVAGNRIGTDAAGTAGPGNGGDGVRLTLEATGNTIGGAAPADRNLIAGNGRDGVSLRADSSTNLILGNFLGVDATGTAALPNLDGVFIAGTGTLGNEIGGALAGEGNVISGNIGSGVFIAQGASSNRIRGNLVGTDATGQLAVPNRGDGVLISDSGAATCDANTIGGTGPGSGNVIAFNDDNGVEVSGSLDNRQNTIRGNRIFANGLLGIDLGDDGVTANDPGDADTGHNDLQNYPVLATAESTGGTTTVTGSLDSLPNGIFLVSFYASSSCDPSGFGEGEVFLGTDTVSTDGSGGGPFAAVLPAATPPGWFVTGVASVSDPTGDSSEFSACVQTAALVEVPALGPLGLLALAVLLAAAAVGALRRAVVRTP